MDGTQGGPEHGHIALDQQGLEDERRAAPANRPDALEARATVKRKQ